MKESSIIPEPKLTTKSGTRIEPLNKFEIIHGYFFTAFSKTTKYSFILNILIKKLLKTYLDTVKQRISPRVFAMTAKKIAIGKLKVKPRHISKTR